MMSSFGVEYIASSVFREVNFVKSGILELVTISPEKLEGEDLIFVQAVGKYKIKTFLT